jgi:hypothetical protein
VLRIPFDLDEMAVTVPGKETATGRALPAGGCIPDGFPGDDILRGKDVGDQSPGRLSRAACEGCCPHKASGFQKIPAVHDERHPLQHGIEKII